MHIRFLDWADSVCHLDHHGNGTPAISTGTPAQPSVRDEAANGLTPIAASGHESLPPGLDLSRQFPVVIGSDIVYEVRLPHTIYLWSGLCQLSLLVARWLHCACHRLQQPMWTSNKFCGQPLSLMSRTKRLVHCRLPMLSWWLRL